MNLLFLSSFLYHNFCLRGGGGRGELVKGEGVRGWRGGLRICYYVSRQGERVLRAGFGDKCVL